MTAWMAIYGVFSTIPVPKPARTIYVAQSVTGVELLRVVRKPVPMAQMICPKRINGT